ncbi:MAG: hypothetical protein K0R36_3955 [Chryseobacterium sp.]|jgi:hypothetical protein|nr:hypothetical protein [Chryseobacterium sp.]
MTQVIKTIIATTNKSAGNRKSELGWLQICHILLSLKYHVKTVYYQMNYLSGCTV